MITKERLHTALDYDPATGHFTWRIRPNDRIRVGSVAGSTTDQGYQLIILDKHRCKAHRLAWLYFYGAQPKGEIDHINGIRGDNRIANLRLADRSQNCANTKMRRHNTSGYKGVSWHKQTQRWRASIAANKTQIHIGMFDTAESAYAAYLKAAEKHHGKFMRAA